MSTDILKMCEMSAKQLLINAVSAIENKSFAYFLCSQVSETLI